MDTIKPRVREFLGQFIRHELSDTDDMFAAGYVNSLFAMQLILFLESEFALRVEDADLELDNFRSVERIERFVAGKLATATATP